VEKHRTFSVGPNLRRSVSLCRPTSIKDDPTRRAAARQAYRAKIESLLNESHDEPLAAVWRRVCPLPIGPEFRMPNRRGMIRDLADFAEVLQPSLHGMKADRLCRLVEKYAACG
jgi:hypothetical protein